MAASWYYVENNDRIGPVEEDEILGLIRAGTIGSDNYVWRKGFDNWKHLKEVDELVSKIEEEASAPSPEPELSMDDDVTDPQLKMPAEIKEVDSDFSWDHFRASDRIFTIRIGLDRGGNSVEYGPFSVETLGKLFNENRINAKTYVFVPGLDNWMLLADIPIYEKISGGVPPVLEESDRRDHIRRPFVARLFFHDNQDLYEGVCRDISVGGLQVLVSDFPGVVGDKVSLNVHPDNTDYQFVASGKIVRVLEGGQGFSMRFSGLKSDASQAIEKYIGEN